MQSVSLPIFNTRKWEFQGRFRIEKKNREEGKVVGRERTPRCNPTKDRMKTLKVFPVSKEVFNIMQH